MSAPTHAQSASKERAILFALTAVQFTHILDYMIMMPLGSQLMRVFAIGPSEFSGLVAAYGIAAALTGFAGGCAMDRFDRKHALLFLYGGFGLSTLACAFAPSYYALLGARFAAGAFGGLASSVVVAMVGDVVPAHRRGRALAIVTSSFPIASVLGVPLGLFLAGSNKWHAPFFLLSALSIPVLLLAARAIPPLKSLHPPLHPLKQMLTIVNHPVHRRGFMMSAVLVFAGGCIIPFLAPAMVANVGLSEEQLPLIYFAGGLCTLFTIPWFGHLSDRYEKLHVLTWVSGAAAIVVLAMTNLPHASVFVAMLTTALFMMTMSGRFAPAMAMLSNAVEGRYRGGFMSVNAAVQQAAGGLANLVAGSIVIRGANGHLDGYPRVGYLSVGCFGLTVYLAARLRALAPHSSRPGHAPTAPMAVD